MIPREPLRTGLELELRENEALLVSSTKVAGCIFVINDPTKLQSRPALRFFPGHIEDKFTQPSMDPKFSKLSPL